MRRFLALHGVHAIRCWIIFDRIFYRRFLRIEKAILIRIAPIYSPVLVEMFWPRQYLCGRLVLLISQLVRSDFGKCVVNLRLNIFDFLFGLLSERIRLGTWIGNFNLLLLDASEQRHLFGARFYWLNGAGFWNDVALRFESLVVWDRLSLDDAVLEFLSLCQRIFCTRWGILLRGR